MAVKIGWKKWNALMFGGGHGFSTTLQLAGYHCCHIKKKNWVCSVNAKTMLGCSGVTVTMIMISRHLTGFFNFLKLGKHGRISRGALERSSSTYRGEIIPVCAEY